MGCLQQVFIDDIVMYAIIVGGDDGEEETKANIELDHGVFQCEAVEVSELLTYVSLKHSYFD